MTQWIDVAGVRNGTSFLTPVRPRARTRSDEAPHVASSRAYLRRGLPAVYQEQDFSMRFVGGFERVLDPIVALLDALPSHLIPELAPPDIVDLLLDWLGVEVPEGTGLAERRALVRVAGELARRRGTRAGLDLYLRTLFPDAPLRVEDAGGVGWDADPAAPPAQHSATFAVYCDTPQPAERLAAIARAIESAKPVHVHYRLRVRQGK